MGNKEFIAVLVCALFASALVVTVAYAQATIPTPSVPEFSLRLVDSFSNINVTNTFNYASNESSYYSIDPFTGGNITQPMNGMLLFDVGTITLTIKNQPFVSYTDAGGETPNYWGGHTISLYYNVRFRPHYAGIWTEIYNAGPASPYHEASNSGSTVTTYELGSKNFVNPTVILAYWAIFPFFGIPPGGQIDFQVQAMIGYTYSSQTIQAYLPYTFSGEVSGWSNIQTVTAGNYSISASPSPSLSLAPSPTPSLTITVSPPMTPTESPTHHSTIEPTPTPNNSQENFTSILIIIGLVVVIVTVVAGALPYLRRTRKLKRREAQWLNYSEFAISQKPPK